MKVKAIVSMGAGAGLFRVYHARSVPALELGEAAALFQAYHERLGLGLESGETLGWEKFEESVLVEELA